MREPASDILKWQGLQIDIVGLERTAIRAVQVSRKYCPGKTHAAASETIFGQCASISCFQAATPCAVTFRYGQTALRSNFAVTAVRGLANQPCNIFFMQLLCIIARQCRRQVNAILSRSQACFEPVNDVLPFTLISGFNVALCRSSRISAPPKAFTVLLCLHQSLVTCRLYLLRRSRRPAVVLQ